MNHGRASLLTLIVLGGGGVARSCDAKSSEKCPFSHSNNTFKKQICLFDSAFVMTNKVQFIKTIKHEGGKQYITLSMLPLSCGGGNSIKNLLIRDIFQL